MVEADCYSQMARVQRILRGQGLIQNHFTVENWPEGLVPSTTAPFDYAILLLYAPLKLITADPLDWAGALISPILWMVLVAFWMFFRSREFTAAGRALFIEASIPHPASAGAGTDGRIRTLEHERHAAEGLEHFCGLVLGVGLLDVAFRADADLPHAHRL
jgi:hypothetical protein